MPLPIDNINDDAGQRPRSGSGFRRHGSRNRRNHDGSGFGLPPRVDDRTTIAADVLSIPNPGFRINWLSDRSQQSQTRQVMLRRPNIAPFDERANRSWSRIKDADLVSFNDGPEPIRLRMI